METEIKQVEFNSIHEASERWIVEGKAYKKALNNWLDSIYIDKKNPQEKEPFETRRNMAGYVIRQIFEFNEKKKHEELRKLFPPDYDPLDKEYQKKFTRCVSKVTYLPNGKIVCTIGEEYEKNQEVFFIDGDSIRKEEDIFTFGSSLDKKYFAKAYLDKIEITEGWSGKVISKLKYPKSYGEDFKKTYPNVTDTLSAMSGQDFQITQLCVFSNGNRIAFASKCGIFVISENGCQLIHPGTDDCYSKDSDEGSEDDFQLHLSYPHVDISPDDKYIAVGSQDSNHIILEEKNGKWEEIAWIEPRSSYPNLAKFNYRIKDEQENPYPQLALSSCHFSRSATIALPIKNLTPNFQASGYDGDKMLHYVDEKNWIFSIGISDWGYYLGSNNGYIWAKYFRGNYQFGYLHIGGTVMDMDFSEDRKSFVVASYSGQIIVFDWLDGKGPDPKKNQRADDYLITNLPVCEKKRYLFWKDHEPMIW